MSGTIFTIDVIATLVLAVTLLYRYGDWFRQRIFVTISVLVAWYFSLLIVFVIPLDVSSTKYRACLNKVNESHSMSGSQATNGSDVLLCKTPYSLLGPRVLPNLWRVLYWSSQFLTWIILPLMQSFTQAGEFTFMGKLKSALRDNVIYYTSYVFIAMILTIYIALKPGLHLNWEKCKAIASSASNTWGLFVLILMLGYGLIEVPRNLWFTDKDYLNRAYFRLAKLMGEKSDAEEELEDVLTLVYNLEQGQEGHCSPMVDTIVKKIPTELLRNNHRIRREIDQPVPLDQRSLVHLHRRTIKALQTYYRTEAQWKDLTNKVLKLEDVNRNMISNEHVFKHTVSQPPLNIFCRMILNPTVEWYWKCLIRPLVRKIGAVCAAMLSAMIIWSEVTFFSSNPTLSLFAIFVNVSEENYFTMELICLITILYLALCTFYTVFKIRVLNYYYIASNHQSNEYTLLFSGALLCRLTPPLCLNFLSLIHMDSHVIKDVKDETAYTKVMGHMDVVSIVSDYINIYLPILLLALSGATYFSLGARCLSALGFQQFLEHDDELTTELVEEGKEHMKREKRSRFRSHPSTTSSSIQQSTSRYQQQSREEAKIPQRTISSPERSLLSYQDAEIPMRKVVPRNIFDDL